MNSVHERYAGRIQEAVKHSEVAGDRRSNDMLVDMARSQRLGLLERLRRTFARLRFDYQRKLGTPPITIHEPDEPRGPGNRSV